MKGGETIITDEMRNVFKLCFQSNFEDLEQNIVQTAERLANNEMSSEEAVKQLLKLFRIGVRKGASAMGDLTALQIAGGFASKDEDKEKISIQYRNMESTRRYMDNINSLWWICHVK